MMCHKSFKNKIVPPVLKTNPEMHLLVSLLELKRWWVGKIVAIVKIKTKFRKSIIYKENNLFQFTNLDRSK